MTAALGPFDGTLTTIRAHERGADGKPNPTYRCLFPEPPPPGTVPACAEAGILGALAGVIGSMAALEVIREIVGFGEGLVGRLIMLDARAMRFETLRYAWDPANPLSGEHPTIRDLSVHASPLPLRERSASSISCSPGEGMSSDAVCPHRPRFARSPRPQGERVRYLLHVAMTVEPLSTDHLLSPALTTVKQ